MSCNSADLKFIPLTLRLKTPHFIQFVLPSTPYSASYSWVHESFISYTVSIFPLCLVYCLKCIRTDVEYPGHVLYWNAVIARPALQRILRSLVVDHRSAESENLELDSFKGNQIFAPFL